MATRYSAVRNPASSLWSRFQDSMTPSIPSILFSRRYTHQPTWLFVVWIWQFNIHNLHVETLDLDSLFAPSDDLLNVIFRIRVDIWLYFFLLLFYWMREILRSSMRSLKYCLTSTASDRGVERIAGLISSFGDWCCSCWMIWRPRIISSIQKYNLVKQKE